MRLFDLLQCMFYASTEEDNRFQKLIQRIKWDAVRHEADEYIFVIGGLTFSTPSLIPAVCLNAWSPSLVLETGDIIFIFA